MKKAFSLIEILVALGMISIIFLVASSLLVSILNSNKTNSREELFEQTKNDIFMGISNDVRWAHSVEYTPGNLGTLVINTNKSRYEVDGNGKLLKNGSPITSDQIRINKFTIENLSTDPTLVSLRIVVEMEHSELSTMKDRVKLVVSQRKTLKKFAI